MNALSPTAASPATQSLLDSLAGCGDVASLRSAVTKVCGEFGGLTHIDILTMADPKKRRALCFLRLGSAAQELRLMTSLGARRFGDDLLVIIDLALMRQPVAQTSTLQEASMNKFSIPFALGAVALLGACASEPQPATSAPTPIVVIVPQQQPAMVTEAPRAALRAGGGRIVSMAAVPVTAGAGATTPSTMRRLGIKMDDGTDQYVDTEAAGLTIGDRVVLTSDGYIRQPLP
jgi:hypothetical protein